LNGRLFNAKLGT